MKYGVPEHSPLLMESLSGGHSFYEDNFLFLSRDILESPSKDNWIMAIGYPIKGEFTPERFENAIEKVKSSITASIFLAIAPQFIAKKNKYIVDKDKYFNLPTNAPTPTKLLRHLKIAKSNLTIEVSKEFSQKHRTLWIEFLGRSPMTARVRSLYANIPNAMAENKADLRLINAYDTDKNLVACMLMDFSLSNTISYILGAHSRNNYVPHASDLILEYTLELARKENKDTLYLGLGVNDGIQKFKEKWGAQVSLDYTMATWDEVPEENLKESMSAIMQSFMQPQMMGMSKMEYMASLPEQRPYAMIWELEKDGKISYLAGTAHFFCYSFEQSLKEIYKNVDTVLFEGPLDHESMEIVSHTGKNPLEGSKRVIDAFNEDEIKSLERHLYGYTGRFSMLFNTGNKNMPNVRDVLANYRPWSAFFTLWTAWLESESWSNSVDMEAYRIAIEMGKNVFGMEDLEEQITSLESAPYERIVRFLKNHKQWNTYKNKNIKSYLAGNLKGMPGTSAEFPTVAERVISPRDERFRQRMRPFIEAGRTIVFVGTAHIVNMRYMAQEDGFNVRRVLPSLSHKMRQKISPDPEYFLPANKEPKPANKSEHVRSPLSLDLLDNIYLQSASTKSFFTAEAIVPEQLEHYVKAVSKVSALIVDKFIAWKSDGLFILNAFPCIGHEEFAIYEDNYKNAINTNNKDYCNEKHKILAKQSIAKIINKFMQSTATNLTILSPFIIKNEDFASYFNAKMSFKQEAKDAWYFMDLPFKPKQKLRNMINRAKRDIQISIEDYTNEHKEIVEQYISSRKLEQGTIQIFRHIEEYCKSSSTIKIYSARNNKNELEAFCIADFSSLSVAYYMFAFRKIDSTPGASDLLLYSLVEEAKMLGFTKINLGLGISDGISFYKTKWNAYPLMPHIETSWVLI